MNPLPWLLGLILTACAGQGADGIPVPPRMDMQRIERPSTPNHALAGAVGHNRQPVDIVTAPYKMTPAALYRVVRTAVLKQPRTYLLVDYPDHLQMHFVVRSAVLNFPDIVSVQIDAGAWEDEAYLTLYSRSVYGYYDFNANKQRLLAWLAAIFVEIRDHT